MAKKILIVEDEKALLFALVEKFKREDFEIISAVNGKIGLEKALKEKPDIILSDIIMPIMDGITMIQELRRDQWGRNAKVIILTNLNDSDQLINAMDRGTYDYLIKSDWDLEDVVKKVKEKLAF